MIDLEKVRLDILVRGPTRVLIDAYEAVPPARAKLDHGVEPDVILIRDDGWSLGAPEHLYDAAFRMWQEGWVAVLYKPFDCIYPKPGPVSLEDAENALKYLAKVNGISVEEMRKRLNTITKKALKEINAAEAKS